MTLIRYTLLSDGSSDRALLPLLEWLLQQNIADADLLGTWADLSILTLRPSSLRDRIRSTLDLYPCDILFIHRDAENLSHRRRTAEIRSAVDEFDEQPFICVVPVRMTEAWMLFDEPAIRHAAGNPNGRNELNLPKVNEELERLPDPKTMLHEALETASGRSARRLRSFRVHRAALSIFRFVFDFSPLRRLPAFSALEREVQSVVGAGGWCRKQ